MANVGMRELGRHAADVIERVRMGERMTITSNGVAVAKLVPISTRPAGISRSGLELLMESQADPGLRNDLRLIEADVTDDPGFLNA